MISKGELQEAIESCKREPFTFQRCEKLAIFYIVYDHLFGEQPAQRIETVAETKVEYEGDSEFSNAVDGKEASKAWSIMDELMEAVKVLQPRIYNSVIQKIHDI